MSTVQAQNEWWVRRWQALIRLMGMDAGADAAATSGMLRGCRVKRLEVAPGIIQAVVQDREMGVAKVEIMLAVLDDRQWERVIDALASQALFAAQLLAGNMPPEIEPVFNQAGAALLPADASEVEHTCSTCAPSGKLCRPLMAVYWQLGEMLAEDPWLLLRLRGRDRQQVLAALHERRNTGGTGEAAVHMGPGDATLAETVMGAFYAPPQLGAAAGREDVEPLAVRLSDFWGRRKVLEDVHHHLARPAAELAILRRLGPPSPTPDGLEAYNQLQTAYRRVTDAAWTLAFAPEEDEDSAAQEGNGTDAEVRERTQP